MFTISREIGIDAGHRVTHHGSKCRNLHGHRYTIQAVCHGGLVESGEQEGMVLDFGFLKEEMIDEIDDPCDHGFILWVNDPLLEEWIKDAQRIELIRTNVEVVGYCLTHVDGQGKLYVINAVPTAENLARHWFERLAPKIEARSEANAKLHQIIVWETPNCQAAYPIV